MATFDVDAFRTRLTNGGARPNQFIVDLGSRGVDGEVASFLVTSASLPGQTIGTASVFYRGREVKLAGDKIFAGWATTILNDGSLLIRSQIERWMEGIENNALKRGAVALQDYVTDLSVTQLDKNGSRIRTYRLIDAWPSDVSEIGLDFVANDTISSFTCTWNYQHFVIETTSGFVEAPQVSTLDGAL